jgi:hypothetical protein
MKKTQDSVHTLEERDIPLEWKEKSERESQCIFNFLKLVAKEALAHKVLDVWNRPEILQSDIRMKILYAVAGRRYKGTISSVSSTDIKTFRDTPN